jgi:hypothetical protein
MMIAIMLPMMMLCACSIAPTNIKSPEGNFELVLAPDWKVLVLVNTMDRWYHGIIECPPQHCRSVAEGTIVGWTLPRRSEIRSVQDVLNRLPIAEARRLISLAISANTPLNEDDFQAVVFDNKSFGWEARIKQPHDGNGNVHYCALMMLRNEAVVIDLWIPEAYEDVSGATINDVKNHVLTASGPPKA